MSEIGNKPNFWDTKEGTWGMVVGLFIIGAIATGIFYLLPTILLGLKMAAMAGIYGIVLGVIGAIALALFYVLFVDDSLRKVAMLKYAVFITNLRKSIIDQDPIAILRVWKERAIKRMKEIRDSKDEVKKQENATLQVHNSFKAEFVKFQREAKALQGDPARAAQFRSSAGRMARAAEMAKKSFGQLEMIQGQYAKINAAYIDLELMYEDMEYEETVLIRDFQMSGSLDKVWSKMRSIFKGDNELDQMRAEAIESMNNKYSERMGRVESAMDDCQGKLDSIRLSREINENEGVEMFNQLAGVDVNQLLSAAPAQLSTHVPAATSSYASLVKK